jgi:hypothetical protein
MSFQASCLSEGTGNTGSGGVTLLHEMVINNTSRKINLLVIGLDFNIFTSPVNI